MSKTRLVARLAATIGALLLTQCGKPTDSDTLLGKKAAENPAVAFDVVVEVTPEAEARFKASGDNLLVDVHYYGYPTEAARPRANQIHQIGLGDDKVAVPSNIRKIHIPGGGLEQKSLGDIEGDVMVLIDGASVMPVGARSDQVVCSFYRERLEVARKQSPVLKCDIPRAD